MDPFLKAAIEEARHGLLEGGIPIGSVLVHAGEILGRGLNRRVQKGSAILLYGIPKVIIGENRNFVGEEVLLRSRGVEVQVLQNPACIEMMKQFVADRPDLWGEDTGQS